MRTKEDYENISGPEKAAILMLALGEENALNIFSLMDEEEIKEISQTMVTLGTVKATVVERLFVDFADHISSTGSLIGSFESTERFLTKVLSKDKVENIMKEIRGPAGRTMWDKLSNVQETLLANYLKNEHPQTVAVILSKVKPEHAARVLVLLPESMAVEVIIRVLKMEPVQKEILEGLEDTLKSEFMSNIARTSHEDAYEVVAEMFNFFDRSTESRFMEALETENKEAASRVRALMFTFEDLAKLPPQSMQTLIKNLDKNMLVLSLKGASEGLKKFVYSNMSERAAKILQDDLVALGLVRVRDVDEAQASIISTAKELAVKGEIFMGDKGDDELIS